MITIHEVPGGGELTLLGFKSSGCMYVSLTFILDNLAFTTLRIVLIVDRLVIFLGYILYIPKYDSEVWRVSSRRHSCYALHFTIGHGHIIVTRSLYKLPPCSLPSSFPVLSFHTEPQFQLSNLEIS